MKSSVKCWLDPLEPSSTFHAESQWLSDDVYDEVVKKTVVTCADAIVTQFDSPGVVFLAKRVIKPQQGFWFLGGRVMFNSDSIAHALALTIKRETGLIFTSDRFTFLTVNDYKFVHAAQGDFPCRSVVLLHRLDVSKQEREAMSAGLVASEYEVGFGLQAFNRGGLVAHNVHPAILDAYDRIWS